MYFFLNSTEAARVQNGSALPTAPVVADVNRPDRIATLRVWIASAWQRPALRSNDRAAQELAA